MPLANPYKIKTKLLYTVVYLITCIYASAQYRDLGIGDQCPDIYLDHVINYSKTSVHLSDFKDKLLILDFWGTWCVDCIATFPKIDSLQKKFPDQLQILPVTKEDKSNIEYVLNNLAKTKGINIPSVANDTLLYRLFYHRYVPHYIWIENGIVKAITGSNEVNETNIRALLGNADVMLPVKKDRLKEFDFQEPLFAGNQIKPAAILYKSSNGLPYHSIVTAYTQEAPPGSRKRKNFIDCSNHIIKQLYQIAFGSLALELMNDNRIVLENFTNANDSMMVGFVAPELKARWEGIEKQYSFCYEQVLTDTTINPQKKFQFMQEDLNNFFANMDITGRLEKRNVKVLALIRTSAIDKLKAKGGPAEDSYINHILEIKSKPINFFTMKLQASFTKPALLILDRTGYNGLVDLHLNADINNIPAVNNELKKYDLQLVEREVELDMIVLSKNNPVSIRALTNK